MFIHCFDLAFQVSMKRCDVPPFLSKSYKSTILFLMNSDGWPIILRSPTASASSNPRNGPGRRHTTRSFVTPAPQVWDSGLRKPMRVLHVQSPLIHETVSFSLKL